jgi:GH25 family lysozyme M1 (1,4-beta-N-acetylmuramidase)
VGIAAGGRGALPLIAMAVVMASGAAGFTVFNSVKGHSSRPSAHVAGATAAGSAGAHGRGSAGDGRAARPAAGAVGNGGRPPRVDGSAAGRFNVGSPHSPELLKRLDGPLSETGRPAARTAQDGSFGAAGGPGASGGSGTAAPLASPSPTAPAAPSSSPSSSPWAPRSPTLIKPSAPPLPKGVDVASFQHPGGAAISWPRVAAAGYTFAAVKTTEGDYYTNPYQASDIGAAKAAGLYVTGYHFAIPNVSTGAAQADYAVSHGNYAADGRTLPLELDVEYDPYAGIDHTNQCYGLTPGQMVSWIDAFGAEAERLTGQAPIIYTTADWWDTCTANSTAFGSDPLWVAAYAESSPPMPAGRDDWTFWQYASSGTVPGIAAAGDTDVSYFGSGLVTLVDPGSQRNAAGAPVSLQLRSLNAAAGQSLSFTASGLPPGLEISDSGQITGTIATKRSGRYPVRVTATGPAGVTGSVSFIWDVSPRG